MSIWCTLVHKFLVPIALMVRLQAGNYSYCSNEKVLGRTVLSESDTSHSLAGLGRRIESVLLCPCESYLEGEHSCMSLSFGSP